MYFLAVSWNCYYLFLDFLDLEVIKWVQDLLGLLKLSKTPHKANYKPRFRQSENLDFFGIKPIHSVYEEEFSMILAVVVVYLFVKIYVV